MDNPSKNIYHLPFIGKIDIRPAPYHFEQIWQRNAVDFALDLDHPIMAAEEGLVHLVIDGNGIGKPDKSFADKANVVIIEHRNKEYSGYVHLRKGIVVNEGQKIKAGQLIGYSGRSGYTTYSHLHFQTMIRKNLSWKTIPTRFKLNEEVKILVSSKN